MEANNGDIVVARIEDEVTVKRLKKSGAKHCITLLPENSSYDPIKIDLRQQQFAIEGLAVGVLRH
jgi:repressor LexA